MDTFHDIFHDHGVLGRGKYATVVKGRKKEGFGLYAIKRVDKSHKKTLIQEVEILQSLDDSKVVKCYDLYETRNDLCLILEYCVGGDLRTILEKDSKLPEDSVYYLALELVGALRYLHSNGIIYGDLKPSNILFDLNGRIKLGDFGLSRKVSDISNWGSPCYMAPELFHDDGVHSYASDLWALGCVLYECHAGRTPFRPRYRDKRFTKLANSILNDPTPSVPGFPNRPFADLVNSLLIKDPSDRIQWSEICIHEYWKTQLSPVPLPPQPAFDNMMQLYNRDVSSNYTENVDLVRLSRIAKLNQNIDEEDDTDVEIRNTDMELDFNEKTEDDTEDEAAELPPDTPTTVDEDLTSNPDHEIDSSPDEPKRYKRESEVDGDDSGGAVNDLTQVLFHPSDLSVLPVIPRKNSSDEQFECSLPFDAIPSSDFVKLPKDQLDDVTKSIVTILDGKTPIGEKQNVVRYMEMLSTNVDAADILTNGSIMPILVKMLRQSKESDFRVQLASLVGLLIRHSTFINHDLSNSGILEVLNECVVDKGQEEVRRFSMAALSELLFYKATTQKDQSKATETKTSSTGWQVPDSLISLVTSLLKKEEEDDTSQLYALRTIEHVSVQGGDWSTCFNTEDVIDNLCNIFRDPGKEETTRLTAGSCLVRIVRFTPPTIKQVMEKLTFKETAIGISSKQNPKEHQICLNLLNMVMAVFKAAEYFPDIGDRLLSLMEDENLVPGIVSLVADGGEVLRGKSLLFVSLVCEHGGDQNRWLGKFFLDGKLASTVEDLVVKEKKKGVYLQWCLEVFVGGVAAVFPEFLDSLITDVEHHLMGERGGTTSEKTTNLHLFPVVSKILGNFPFSYELANVDVLNQLKVLLIKLMESPFQGSDDYQRSVLYALNSFTENASCVDQNWKIFVHEILPIVSTICKGSKRESMRFLCMKIWSDVVHKLLFYSSSFNKDELRPICIDHFLPLYPQLMDDDEDSIPGMAERLCDTLSGCDVI